MEPLNDLDETTLTQEIERYLADQGLEDISISYPAPCECPYVSYAPTISEEVLIRINAALEVIWKNYPTLRIKRALRKMLVGTKYTRNTMPRVSMMFKSFVENGTILGYQHLSIQTDDFTHNVTVDVQVAVPFMLPYKHLSITVEE